MAANFQQQHPIPQQISSYQFRLVGDMTIKQFFQVAGGALVALLLYSTNLVSFIKWPLMALSFLFGIALAFVPLEERPLEKWIGLFLKSIYSPTLFFWVKQKPIAYFRAEETPEDAEQVMQTQIKPQTQTTTTPAQNGQQTSGVQQSAIPAGIDTEATTAVTELEHEEKRILSEVKEHFGTIKTESIQETSPGERTFPKPVEKTVKIPDAKSVTVAKPTPQVYQTDTKASTEEVQEVLDTVSASPGQSLETTREATFSTEAAPPIPPMQPNIIVGQVLDTEGKILDGAILEIRDKDGRPARAFKSNKLGHFGIVTPLVNGKYEIITEKEGYVFEPVYVEVVGEIVQPIAIKASEKVES